MKFSLAFFLLIWGICSVSAQQLSGTVLDTETNETIPGVNVYTVVAGKIVGTITDSKGYYILNLPVGEHAIHFTFVGYADYYSPLILNKNDHKTLNVSLVSKEELLERVVVSAGRFEQRLSDVTVSMRVVSPEEIVNQSASDISKVLNTLPGVDIVDNQPSIRSGSGWTYGVGSRSLVLIDEMPVLTPDVGDIMWGFLPTEGVSQIEVMKGASSVLYGSSALNGVINIRTKAPTETPETSLIFYNGIYLNPKNSDYVWWDKSFWQEGEHQVTPFLRRNIEFGIRNPINNGLQFSHSRKLGSWDMSVNGNIYQNEGFRQDDYEQRVRIGLGLRYYDQKVNGLNYGVNVNGMSSKYSDFFIWRSADSPYEQSPLSNMRTEMNMMYIDPFLNYVDAKHNASHQLRTRYFYKSSVLDKNPVNQDLFSILGDMDLSIEDIASGVSFLQNEFDWLTFLGEYGSGDYMAMFNDLAPVINQMFPNITPDQVMDLVGWGLSEFGETGSAIPDKTYSLYTDYQFHKTIGDASLTAGGTYNYFYTDSPVNGIHNSDNVAGFFQYDQRFWDKLSLSLGVRCEYYRVDSLKRESETDFLGVTIPVKPVFRGGLNYQLYDYTFLRASFGQGYRYPSVVEKYIYKDIGGIAAFPSPDLKPESGWNAEVGVKQAYKLGKIVGFIDVAGFVTRYYDMIEFQFGLFNTETYEMITDLGELSSTDIGLGVNFGNVSNSRISGLDASISGMVDFAPGVDLKFSVGYVFAEPIDIDWEEKLAAEQEGGILEFKEKSNDSKYLKYRQKHTVKGVCDFSYKRVSFGFNAEYKSKTLAVDYFLVDERPTADEDPLELVRSLVFPGLNDYWLENNNGFFKIDLRFGVKVSQKVKIQAILNNALNSEYSLRPMDVSAPRNIVFQMQVKF